ncbi:MAG TPA: hypothetical protein VFB50_06340 [Chloroflexota bacterium]|nr:hypothetical protein [Chloroflexota bacterium]
MPTAVATPSPLAAPSLVAAPSPLAKPSASASPSPLSAGTPPPAGARRVEVLSAANAALARGNAPEAAGLYERVVNTPPAPDEVAAASTVVTDFAHFRAMVSLLAAGDEEQAREHLNALRDGDANAPLTRLAAQVWDQYGMTASIRAACAQATPQVASQAGPVLTALQGQGVNVDPNNFCGIS